MYQHHLAELICPTCGSVYTLNATQQNDDYIVAGTLRCTGCEHSVPIRGGIPRFHDEGYVSNFGKQWKQFKQIERFYTATNEVYFAERVGLKPPDITGTRLLEIGCGNGRAVGHFLQGKPELYAAIDLSSAVDVVEEQFRQERNLLIIQSDLRMLPLKRATFDAVFSMGVIHHTPQPPVSFNAIVPFVKPGGKLAIWVYHPQAVFGRLSIWIQRHSHRIPRPLLLIYCVWIARLSSLLYWWSKTPILKRSYNLVLRATKKVFRVAPDTPYELNYLRAHDFHTTRYIYTYLPDDVHSWYEAAGFDQIEILPIRLGVIGAKR